MCRLPRESIENPVVNLARYMTLTKLEYAKAFSLSFPRFVYTRILNSSIFCTVSHDFRHLTTHTLGVRIAIQFVRSLSSGHAWVPNSARFTSYWVGSRNKAKGEKKYNNKNKTATRRLFSSYNVGLIFARITIKEGKMLCSIRGEKN